MKIPADNNFRSNQSQHLSESFYEGERLKNILNQINAGIAQTDRNGKFVEVNDRFCEITEYTREALLQLTVLNITHPDDHALNLPLFEDCVENGNSFYIEKRYVRCDGSIVWVNNGVSRVKLQNGEVRVIAVSVDISAHKLAEKVLRDSEERYHNFIHRSAEGIWRFELEKPLDVTISAEEQIEHFYHYAFLAECNDAMAKMYGFEKAEELTGARLSSFFEKDGTSADYFRLFIKSDYRIESAESIELDRNGNTKFFLNNLVGIVENGFLSRAWGTQRDITEQRNAEESLRLAREKSEKQRRLYETIANSTPDLIYVFDTKYKFTYVNKALLSMWGKSWDEAIGRGLRENGYEEWHAEMHEREIDTVIATKKPIRGVVSFPHATLGERIYDYIFAPVINDTGEVEAIAGTTRDITDFRQAENAVKESEERYRNLAQSLELLVQERTRELHRSNQDLQQFAHVASHDMKEPLRKLRMFGGRLSDEYGHLLPEQGTTYLRKMEAAAERMYAMIEGVLLYSSFNAIQQSLELVDLKEVVNDVCSDLEMTIEKKNAVVVTGELTTLWGTRILIYQLIYNLVNNSLKFSRPDITPQVLINTKVWDDSTVLISVEDNGIGFDNTQANAIFDPFIRLHAKDKFEGTGLGLALCRNIVERHGGQIRAEGRPGEGAIFYISLPPPKE